jgi:hypothetical protein
MAASSEEDYTRSAALAEGVRETRRGAGGGGSPARYWTMTSRRAAAAREAAEAVGRVRMEVPMIRGIRRSAIAAVCLALLCLAPLAGQASKNKTYTVSDAKSLVKAIGPDRTVVLKKGDYKLASVTGVKNEYVKWNELENGREFTITGVKNLTIRGADGARIVGDSPSAYLLCVSECDGLILDNLRFARVLKGDAEVNGGSLYAESTEGLEVNRCSFERPTGVAIELWGCPEAKIKNGAVEGTTWLAFSFVESAGVELHECTVIESAGYPLVYVEDSGGLLVEATRFERCTGGNFVEIYSQSGEEVSAAFVDCVFAGNQFEYFSGTSMLPLTENCSYEGDNSFDEYWPDYSVAYVADESYYGNYGYGYGAAEGIPAYYADWSSGLAFSYPGDWQLEDFEEPRRIGLISPDGSCVALFVPVSENVDADLEPEELFALAAEDFVSYMADNANSGVSMEIVGEISDETGILSAEYRGEITFLGDGGTASIRVRLFATDGAVHAFAAVANDEYDLEPGLDLDLILGSVDYAPRGE